jgi:negative modulator of initiation of replication
MLPDSIDKIEPVALEKKRLPSEEANESDNEALNEPIIVDKQGDKLMPKSDSFCNSELPEAFSNGVSFLFTTETFQQEPVITNKFNMMLTTMYFENREAFVEASKVAKGRSRDYLGENLEKLLASDNQEEVDLLIASKPRDIPYTPFWVVTNANTGRKRIILTQVMASMGYPHHLIERIKEEI